MPCRYWRPVGIFLMLADVGGCSLLWVVSLELTTSLGTARKEAVLPILDRHPFYSRSVPTQGFANSPPGLPGICLLLLGPLLIGYDKPLPPW